MSRYLDLNFLRHAQPDERIAALRRMRHDERQRQHDASAVEGPETAEEERRRSGRLARRFRETFRIRTRMQTAGEEEAGQAGTRSPA